jgi:hypothetical protein
MKKVQTPILYIISPWFMGAVFPVEKEKSNTIRRWMIIPVVLSKTQDGKWGIKDEF